jgi:VWFA-related protein
MIREAIRCRPLVLLAIGALACGAFFATPAAGAKPAPERPATVITIEAVIAGSQGEHLADLRASEIHVFEDKKEQKILLFRPRERGVPQQALLRPNEFSNRSRPLLPPPTVVLLDLLNERFSTGTAGSFEIGKALQALEPSERLSMYLLTRHAEIDPVHSLQQAEADVAESRAPWTRGAVAIVDAAMRSALAMRSGDLSYADLRFDPTMRALQSLATRMAAVPGRKNLIWVTHGVPLTVRDVSGEPIDLTPNVRKMAASLARFRIAVYAVAQSAEGAGGGFDLSADMLRLIADWSGGREYGSDAIDAAINESIRDARNAYIVAYERPAQKRPPQYHKLQLSCDRKGARILARQGDVDAVDLPPSDQELLAGIESAARATLDCPEIGVQAQVSSTGASPPALHLDIHIDPRDVLLRPGGDGRLHSQLALVIAEYEDGGLKPLPLPAPLDMNLSAEPDPGGARDGYDLTRDLPASPGSQEIRCIVMDRDLNLAGSVTVPLPGRAKGRVGINSGLKNPAP